MTDALMVTSSFLPGRGGIESYLAELCDAVAPRVAVLAPPKRDGQPLPTDLGYPVFGGPGSMLIPSKRVVRAIERTCASLSTDKVLFGTPWPLGLLGPRLSAAGLRYAAIVHGAELKVPAAVPLLKGRLAEALAGADLLMPVSDYTNRMVHELIARKQGRPHIENLRARVDLSRFHPDVNTSAVRDALGLSAADRVVLCFGRLVRRKGVHRLIEAMPEISRRVPHTVLVIAGTGPELGKLRHQAARAKARVLFAGRVPDEHAPAYYRLADVFALPVVDRWAGLEIEGLGVVLLEAAATGTPSVTGRSGGTPEAVLDGDTGFVVDARDPDQLCDRIVRLLKDPGLAERMGAAGRSHVEAEYSADIPPKPLLDWLA
ncbi:MAG: phosphatidyl-myo-inositol dimannoside synthase [Actinomycetota bacterium]|jgi:phosphatidylinositol alpha-1,6-mannosyltransferase|nr:phosphatidyl-myo-inositol dimannoside synthase [Actinomycetota bacterium]